MSAGVLAQERRSTAWRLERISFDPHGIAAFVLPFAAIFYLALEGGGYDTVVRSQVGVVLWWLVLIGALVGVLPSAMSRGGWIALGLLTSFAVWTALSLTWTESEERTAIEVARVLTFMGTLAVGLALAGRDRQRQVIGAIATATALVAFLGVASRLRPEWFPENHVATGLGDFKRLSYPLNYWNGLAAFVAMGIPALLAVASGARSLVLRAFAAAAVPVMLLCVFLTESRGGLAATVLGIIVFLALAPDRVPRLATLGAVLGGAAILYWALAQRDELRDGVGGTAAHDQATTLAVVILLVALGTACVQLAIGLADRHAERVRWLRPTRRTGALMTATVVLIGLAVAIALGAPSAASEAWDDFKNPTESSAIRQDSTFSRLASVSGRGRYQFWQAAVEQQSTRPWQGTGAGTWEYWWARHPLEERGFVRDAHSLYMQTFGELGIVGLVLIVCLLLYVLLGGVLRSLGARPEARLAPAAATAGISAFMLDATVDWIWQLTVLPVALMFFIAVVFSSGGPSGRRSAMRGRAVAAIAALVALPTLAVQVAGSSAVADSQRAARQNDLALALDYARTAVRAQPYAATPRIQEALVLEASRDLRAAVAAAGEATERESTNWRAWLTLARIEAELGRSDAALRHFRRARDLNPQSPIFR
jgi:hypothetical protein